MKSLVASIQGRATVFRAARTSLHVHGFLLVVVGFLGCASRDDRPVPLPQLVGVVDAETSAEGSWIRTQTTHCVAGVFELPREYRSQCAAPCGEPEYYEGWVLDLEPSGAASLLPTGDIVVSGEYRICGGQLLLDTDEGQRSFDIVGGGRFLDDGTLRLEIDAATACGAGQVFGSTCTQCGSADECEVSVTGCLPACVDDDDCEGSGGSCHDGYCGALCG